MYSRPPLACFPAISTPHRALAWTLALSAVAAFSPPGHFDAAAATTAGMTERVTVTATRLPDQDTLADEVPATVTVITREEIERSGARNIQDLLEFLAGVAVYDQVGNGVQRTFDLRGFAGGSGTAVFLDGARLNDPRNNSVALELIPVDAVDRIEILRGSAGAVTGGGSEAGVIQILTRRGTEGKGSVSAGAGTFGARRAGGTLEGRAGEFELFFAADRDWSDGFRENSESDQRHLTATAGLDLGKDRRVSLSVLGTRADFGAPGALTATELEANAALSPFNRADDASDRLRQESLNFRGPVGGGFTLAANLFDRRVREESLSTGRAAPLFGGFFLESGTTVLGSTIQASRSLAFGPGDSEVTFGGEWLRGTTGSLGFFTPKSDPAHVDRGHPGSDNEASRRTLAAFAQDSWKATRSWTFTGGVRVDRDRIGYDETLPDPSVADSRSFSDTSLRAGAAWNSAVSNSRPGYYLSYGESFLPPTVEQLFAFPGFSSNPSLQPQKSRTVEAGARGRFARGRAWGSYDAALFRVNTADEIIFDPTSLPGNPIGRNVNAGRTERNGIEASARGRLASRWSAFAGLSLTKAEFQNGRNRGKTVPLVPRRRGSLGVDVDLPEDLRLRLEALYVGDQVLDNDAANAQPRLPSYTVVNFRATCRLWGAVEGRAARERKGVTGFFEARNLFDRSYSTRGIYATDYSACINFSCPKAAFFTPAPGRRYIAGAEWSF